jgi:hypothetical protein
MENIKDVKVCNAILDDIRAVIYMPINPKKIIYEFKKMEMTRSCKIFNNIVLMQCGDTTFGHIIPSSVCTITLN